MFAFPIGVILESFRLPIREAISAAAQLGVQGIQAYATRGELSPENMTLSKRREFLDMVRSHGLTISALCGDLGHGFGDREKNPMLIEKSKRILDLALELGTDIVTTHIGVVPKDKSHDRYKVMQEACYELASYAKRTLSTHTLLSKRDPSSNCTEGVFRQSGFQRSSGKYGSCKLRYDLPVTIPYRLSIPLRIILCIPMQRTAGS